MRLMEGMSKIFFVSIIVLPLIAKQVRATQHVVGGSQGWDESVDLNSWASAQTFKVGDQLGASISFSHLTSSVFTVPRMCKA